MAGELRSPIVTSEPLTEGESAVRSPLVTAEPLAEGTPNLRQALLTVDALAEGYRNLRVCLLVLETLVPIPVEEFMSTEKFPGFGNSSSNPSIPAGADPFNSPLPGLSFSVHKKPQFRTRIAEAAGGQEDRNTLWEMPRWDFELTYEFLEDRSGADSSLKSIMGFFLEMGGSFDTWLFKDPDDYKVEAGYVGEGDGVTTQFYFRRALGNFREIVGQVDTDNDINLYADGVLIPASDYTVTMPNYIVFDSAPASGVEITADFQFFFVCRFIEDQMDFEKFMDKLWSLQSCEFRSVIQ
jgi:uncharacterized protein (TIGR02217 family)